MEQPLIISIHIVSHRIPMTVSSSYGTFEKPMIKYPFRSKFTWILHRCAAAQILNHVFIVYVLTLNSDNPLKHNLSRIAFSQSRPGMLASLSKDSIFINLWDIQETGSLRSTLNASSRTDFTYPMSTQQPLNTSSTSLLNYASEAGYENLGQISEDDLSIPVLWKNRKSKSFSQ